MKKFLFLIASLCTPIYANDLCSTLASRWEGDITLRGNLLGDCDYHVDGTITQTNHKFSIAGRVTTTSKACLLWQGHFNFENLVCKNGYLIIENRNKTMYIDGKLSNNGKSAILTGFIDQLTYLPLPFEVRFYVDNARVDAAG
ncbi:MAG: hypothetical protein H0W64_01645 [Gammaproteobacteria bacterium]|nr:hypothetical protein [Gammaproteobacteria bacterium]